MPSRKHSQLKPVITNEILDDGPKLTEDEAHQLLLELKKEETTLKQLLHEFIKEMEQVKMREVYIKQSIEQCKKQPNHNGYLPMLLNVKSNGNDTNHNKTNEEIVEVDGDDLLRNLFQDVLNEDFSADDDGDIDMNNVQGSNK